MINSVRNTVLSILNKNNYGYMPPSDFNLFAKQAQLEIFDEYFSRYNRSINLENARQSGVGYANGKKANEEAIDVFSETKYLKQSGANKFFLPSITTTGDDYYMINTVVCYTSVLAEGSATSTVSGSIADTNADFVGDGVRVGDIISNTTDKVTTIVTGLTSDTQLAVEDDIFEFGDSYVIHSQSVYKEAEKVSQKDIRLLNVSLLTAPSNSFPAYAQEGSLMTVYPSTIDEQGAVLVQYLRYPKDPKWTYISLERGEPVFNPSAADYQDFELPIEDEPLLVTKILQYAGLSIREAQVVNYGAQEEVKDMQK